MKEKYFCRTCHGLRNHTELFTKNTNGDEGPDFQWFKNYKVIECRGCETISFLEVYGNSEMQYYNQEDGNAEYYDESTIYPVYLSQGKEIEDLFLMPLNLRTIYSETINALKSNLLILTAGGLRAIIEAICNELKIKKGNLSSRIDELYNKKYLTLNESKRLHTIRFLGNDALHELELPQKDQLYLTLEMVNHLLENLFINDLKIKGNLETLIDNYDEFIRLVKSKIKEPLLNKNVTISAIIGKSKRRLSKQILEEFEKRLEIEVREGKHQSLMIEENFPNGFLIVKIPVFYNSGIS